MERLFRDIRHAVAMLGKRPAFSTTVAGTLALGIGAITAIFSVIHAVLLRPLPYPESDRLVNVWGRFLPESGFDFPSFPISEPEYIDYRDGNVSMEAVALFAYQGVNIVDGAGEPERVLSAATSANLFDVLRITPVIGRAFVPSDDVPGAAPVVLLSESIWNRRFAADPSVVGRTISVGGIPTEVIGVMPRGFAFPAVNTELWIPYQLDEANPGGRSSHSSYGIARLADGSSLEQARSELEIIMAQWKQDYPNIHTGHFIFLRPMIEDVVGDVRTALWLVFAAVGFLMLIACANVANLLLAHGEHRRREMAVRSALGAGRGRLMQQLFTENLVLSGLGGAAGLLLAFGGLKTLLVMDAGSIPRAGDVSINVTVLLFTLGVSLGTSLLFGLLPAWQTAGADLRDAIHEGNRSATVGLGRIRFRRSLVVAQVALCVLLVIGAGLTIRSFSRLVREDPGFEASNLLVAQLSLSGAAYTPDEANEFYATLLGSLNAIPGVQSASAVSALPIMHGRSVNDFQIEGRPAPGPGETALNAAFASPWPDYFETMRIRLIRGRTFSSSDHVQSEPVAMINETFAQRFFGTEDPLGKRIRFSAGDATGGWRRIVGVVADVKFQGLSIEPRPAYYFPNLQALQDFEMSTRFMAIVIRTTGDPVFVGPQVRRAVADLDPALPIVGMQSMTQLLHQSVAQPRFVMTLLAVFGGIGLILGAIGIYGVVAYGVAQRANEIGIRIALGARAAQVVGMVVSQGLAMAALGVGIGIVGALAGTRAMESQLFGISTNDLGTFTAVSVLLLLVAFVASYVPARRAARVDPIEALRTD